MLQPPFTASLAMVPPSNSSMHQAAMSLRAHARFSCTNGFHLVGTVQTFFSSPSWAVPIPTEELKTCHNMQAITGGFLHTCLLLEVVPCSQAWTLCAVRYCTVDQMHPTWSGQRPKSCRSAQEQIGKLLSAICTVCLVPAPIKLLRRSLLGELRLAVHAPSPSGPLCIVLGLAHGCLAELSITHKWVTVVSERLAWRQLIELVPSSLRSSPDWY